MTEGAPEEIGLERGDDIAAEVVAATGDVPVADSGQKTAKKAVEFFVAEHGYIAPTKQLRRHVAMAFAGKGKVVYGQAFDAVRVLDGGEVDFEDLSSVEANLSNLVL